MTTDIQHPYLTVVVHICGCRVVDIVPATDREDAQRQAAFRQLRPCFDCEADWRRKTS